MTSDQIYKALSHVARDGELLEVARQAIESTLLELRESRICYLNAANGLVIREADGRDSHVIRLRVEKAMAIGLLAIAAKLSPANHT